MKLFILSQSLILLREFEKQWDVGEGGRDDFYLAFSKKAGAMKCVLYLFSFRSWTFEVVHLPSASLLPPLLFS